MTWGPRQVPWRWWGPRAGGPCGDRVDTRQLTHFAVASRCHLPRQLLYCIHETRIRIRHGVTDFSSQHRDRTQDGTAVRQMSFRPGRSRLQAASGRGRCRPRCHPLRTFRTTGTKGDYSLDELQLHFLARQRAVWRGRGTAVEHGYTSGGPSLCAAAHFASMGWQYRCCLSAMSAIARPGCCAMAPPFNC